MNRCVTCVIAAGLLATAGGLTVTGLGLIDVSAVSGHYAITEWALHSVMRASVRTAALSVDTSDRTALHNDMTVAAVHFERGCSTCHGSPRRNRSPEIMAMLPAPPDLAESIGFWRAEELFVIVRDGIRYTGMPAWPAATRDDEVWAMVAFLQRLPALDAADYSKLLNEEPYKKANGRSCGQCHHESNPSVPDFNGQSETYLGNSLANYLEGKRASGIMQVAVAGMEPSDIAAVSLELLEGERACVQSKVVASLPLISKGDADRKIPACNGCHDGQRPDYPLLDGLPAAYIANQLLLFREGRRGEGINQERMALAARNLSDDDIRLAADYFSSQAPRSSACDR